MHKVMVFTAVGERLEPDTVKAILALQWDGPISFLFQKDNPYDRRESILHHYQKGRTAFLAGDFDYFLTIESDIVPPPDTITRLMALDCDVAYAVAQLRSSPVINIFEKYPGGRNPGSSLTFKPRLLESARRAGVYDCSGGGLGCVLIRRHVLEDIDFRLIPKDGAYCDTYFNRDVLQGGYSQKADMNLLCDHIDDDGTVLRPFED